MSKALVVLADDIKKGKLDLSTKTNSELVELINSLTIELNVRTGKFLEKGNKSAARDARKVTLGLEKVFKAFRKASV